MKTSAPFSPGSSVVAYLRDSGGDEQDLSIPQQEQALREWCQLHGLALAGIYADTMTGSTARRESFQRMIHDIHNGLPVAGVIVWRSNRFGRNINDATFYRADLRRRGVEIYSLTDNIPEGATGQLVEFALTWHDQIFLEQLSEDVKRGLAYLVSTHGGMPGTPPRGFKRVPVDIGRRRDGSAHIVHRWEPDPEKIPLVQQAFQMRVAGATLPAITKATGLYKSKTCWVTFFKNPLYIGRLEYGGQVFENYCQPLVDVDTWNAAQLVGRARSHTRNNPQHPRRLGSEYPFSGLLYCQECGSPLSVHTISKWEYYDCARKMRTRECLARAVPRAPLENILLETIRHQILDAVNLEQIHTQAMVQYHATASGATARRDAAAGELRQTRRALNNLVDAIGQAGPSAALLDALREKEAQAASLELELAGLDAALLPPETFSPARVQELLETLETTQPHPAEFRLFLQAWVARIIVRRDDAKIHGVIEYTSPLETKTPPGGGIIGNRSGAPTGTGTVYQYFTTAIKPHKKPAQK